MNKSLRNWFILIFIYCTFFVWYTDLGGKLDSDEIATYLVKMQDNREAVGFSSPEEKEKAKEQGAIIEEFMREDSGRQFFVVNNIDMSENPQDVEGAKPGEDADQLMGRYMEHMYAELFKRASHPVFLGSAVSTAIDIVGIENAESWDSAALMRYKSRRAFMEIVSNPKMLGKHEFKIAALNKTIAYPVETVVYLSDPRLLLGLILIIIGLIIQLRIKK
ncbi:MAG: hypothetical protein P8N10_01970 [SAR86 cluster bacterium]|nr:hypothetical protein [SAR86 cluster bacterium]